MKLISRALGVAVAMTVLVSPVFASKNKYSETVTLFKNAGESATFFDKSYAYAVFPTVGEGAVGVGGALGSGHVYVHGKWVGDVTLKQVSIGFQLGGKAFSQIIFFEDERALKEFESGSFEFGADAGVVAVTAGAHASTGTNGTDTGASGGKNDAITRGQYQKGMATFTIAKGGAMFQVSVAGQKFEYSKRGEE